MNFVNFEMKIRGCSDEVIVQKTLEEYKEELLKKFLHLRTCMNILDNDEYIEISLCCRELKFVVDKLAKWEGYREESLNDCRMYDYIKCLDNYSMKI